MALSKILRFDWDRLLAKVESAEVKRSINVMRGKANEIVVRSAYFLITNPYEFIDGLQTNSSKFVKAPEPIDFNAYKAKLKFSATAVEALEVLLFIITLMDIDDGNSRRSIIPERCLPTPLRSRHSKLRNVLP